MKKRTWKALLVLLICLACRQGGVACGFYINPNAYHLTLFDYYLLRECISSDFFHYDNYKGKCSGYTYLANFEDYDTYYNQKYEEYDTTDYNLVAWQALTSTKIPHQDIEAIVNLDSLDNITGLAEKWGKMPASALKNRFIKFLVQNQRKDILTYLLFMQKCGKLVRSGYYEWSEKKQEPKNNLDLLLEEGKKLITQEKNLLLRQRYLFQLVRIAKRTKKPQKAFQVYEQFFEPEMPKNYLYGQTLYNLAVLYPKEKELSEYAKLYFLFRNIDKNFARSCYESCKQIEISNKAEFEKCLNYAENGAVKSTIWTLAHFEDDFWVNYLVSDNNDYKSLYSGLDFLKGAYQNNPTDINAEILLIRELQEIEKNIFRKILFQKTELDSTVYQKDTDKFVNPPIYQGDEVSIWQRIWKGMLRIIYSFFNLFLRKEEIYKPNNVGFEIGNSMPDRTMPAALYDETWRGQNYSNVGINPKYELSSFRQFVEQVAQSNQANQPALWHLVAAYLNIMQKDFARAGQFVKSGKTAFGKYKGQNPNILKQLEMFELYASMEKEEKVGVDFEQQLLQFANNQKDTTYNFDRFFYSRLAQKYLAQGDFAKSVLALYRAGTPEMSAVLVEMYADDTKMKELLAFTQKEQKSDFEQYLIKTTLNTNQVLEVYATQLGRDNRFGEGLSFLQKIDSNYWKNAFEFEAKIGNKYTGFQSIKTYNRLTFFQLIDSLNKVAPKATQVAEVYMQIGDLLFSTPYWAYSNRLWQGNLTDVAQFFSGNQYPFNISDSFSTQLYIGKNKFLNRYGTGWLAGQYYQKVMELDTNGLGMIACYLGLNASSRTLTKFHESYKSDFDLFKKAWLEDYQNAEGVEQILEDCPALKEMR
ncbi:MAG: hypothetical protein MUE81_10350 [Thermoflexibacter sp.]|jgi:hypothetical protein|nr:hypothetical protein [Thermoflexibacter sp.]